MKKSPKKMTRKQHFVPQFYLQHFADSFGRLHAYRRDVGSFFLASPDKLCAKHDLYEVRHSTRALDGDEFYAQNHIEEGLSAMEGRVAPFYGQLLECCDRRDFVSEKYCDGRLSLCVFAANLIVRHPMSFDVEVGKINEFVEEFDRSCTLTSKERALLEKSGWKGDKHALVELAVKSTLLFSCDSEVPFSRIYDAFCEKPLSILKAPVGAKFITTSMPMFIIGPDDDSYDIDMAYIPLSDTYAAVFANAGCFPSFMELGLQQVAVWNHLLLFNCPCWDVAMSSAKAPLEASIRDWEQEESSES